MCGCCCWICLAKSIWNRGKRVDVVESGYLSFSQMRSFCIDKKERKKQEIKKVEPNATHSLHSHVTLTLNDETQGTVRMPSYYILSPIDMAPLHKSPWLTFVTIHLTWHSSICMKCACKRKSWVIQTLHLHRLMYYFYTKQIEARV